MLFSKNLFKLPESPSSTHDLETQRPSPRSSTEETADSAPHISSLPLAITTPLRIDVLPKDFEPRPQAQGHYSTPEQAADAGIEPPTPVVKARMAERMSTRVEAADQEGDSSEFDHVHLVTPGGLL